MKHANTLFILSNGRVAAINKKDGSIIWEIQLKAHGISNMAHSIGQIMVENNKIYIGCAGILLCLDTKDGALIWKNELKGWGFNFVSMANINNDAAASKAASDAAAATMIATT